MVEGFLIKGIEFLVGVTKGVIMALFVNWWRKQTIANITTTTTHEKVKVKALFDGRIPHLLLSWTMVNRSMVNIKIKRVAGELHSGAWRIASFDSDRIRESHYGYTWNPLIASQKTYLKKKGDSAEITVTIFPSLEFWLFNISPYGCSLYNSIVEVSFTGGSAITELSEDNLIIEGAESIENKLIDTIRNTIKTKLGDPK